MADATVKTMPCYVCSHEIAIYSMESHVKVCIRKWEHDNSLKPLKERPHTPQPPPGFMEKIKYGVAPHDNHYPDIDTLADDAFKRINSKQLENCANCGRKFLPDRLQVHIRSCNKAYGKPVPISEGPGMVSYEIIDGNKGQQSPQLGGGSKLQMNNEEGFKGQNDNSTLEACMNCGRRFLPDSLVIHLRSCNKQHGKHYDHGHSQTPEKQNVSKKPISVTCYICGREYGAQAIEIHLKGCLQKWEYEESKKLPQNRRQPPQPPAHFDILIQQAKQGNILGYDVEHIRNDAFQQLSESVLIPCHNCGRKFLPERLEVHLRSCDRDFNRKPHEVHHQANHSLTQVNSEPQLQQSQFLSQQQQWPQESRQLGVSESQATYARASINSIPPMSNNTLAFNPETRLKPIKGQESVNCNLCGRQFSQAIIDQHMKACQKRWMPQQQQQYQ